MAKGGTLHMQRDRHEGEGLDLRASLCGMIAVALTDDAGLVRCKLCRARMTTSIVERDVKPDNVEQSEPAPFVAGPPVPTSLLGGAHTLLPRELRVLERVARGEELDERPRWRSLDAAIAKTTEIEATHTPIRSGWKAEQESRSEGAVRVEGGRDHVIEVQRAFALCITEPYRIGAAGPLLEPARASALVEHIARGFADATQIANDINASDDGFFVTAREVGELVRLGKSAMRSALERKGLIEKRVRRGHASRVEEGQTMAAPHGFDLETWKEILPLLGGISETKATELMERPNDPLPVRKWFSGKVIARRVDILEWIARQTTFPKSA